MRAEDVKVGEMYETRIGGEKRLVRVLYKRDVRVGPWGSERTAPGFVVATPEGRVLPKVRRAVSLTPAMTVEGMLARVAAGEILGTRNAATGKVTLTDAALVPFVRELIGRGLVTVKAIGPEGGAVALTDRGRAAVGGAS